MMVNVHLPMVKMVNFMSCVFYHNTKYFQDILRGKAIGRHDVLAVMNQKYTGETLAGVGRAGLLKGYFLPRSTT